MKKTVSLILSMALSVSMLTAVKAEEKKYGILVDEGFNEANNSLFNLSDTSIVSDNTPGIGKAAVFTKPGSSAALEFVSKTFEPTNLFNTSSGVTGEGGGCVIETEFDIKIPNATTCERPMQIRLLSSGNTSTDTYTGYAIIDFDNVNKQILLQGRNADNMNIMETINGGSFEFGKWYRIKLITKISDGADGNAKRITDFLVNGISKMTNPIRFFSENNTKIPYYDKFTLKVDGWSTEETAVWLDNYSVYKYNNNTSETGTAKMPANVGALISEIREKQAILDANKDTGKYTEAAAEEFQTAIDSAYNVYEKSRFKPFTEMRDGIHQAVADLGKAQTKFYAQTVKPNGIIFSEDFEGETNSLFLNQEYSEIILDDEKGTNCTYKMISPTGKTLQVFTSEIFEATNLFGATDEGPSCYVETEFDFKVKGIYTRDALIKLYSKDSPDTTSYANIRFKGEDNIIYLEGRNAEGIVTIPAASFDDDEWVRIRVVAQVSDENGNGVQKISGFYVNGVNYLVNAIDFLSTNSAKIPAYDRIMVELGSMSDSSAVAYMDNFVVNKYNSYTVSSEVALPLVNKGRLIHEIRSKEKQLNALVRGNGIIQYSQNRIDNYQAQIDEFYQTYLIAGQIETDDATAEIMLLEFFPNSGIKVGTPKFYCEDKVTELESPEDSNGIWAIVPLQKEAEETEVTMYLAVYDSVSERLEAIAVGTSTEDGAEAYVDTSTIQDKSGIYCKVFIWDNALKPLFECCKYE